METIQINNNALTVVATHSPDIFYFVFYLFFVAWGKPLWVFVYLLTIPFIKKNMCHIKQDNEF